MRFDSGYRTVGMAAEHMYIDMDRMKRGEFVYSSIAKEYKNGAKPTDMRPSSSVLALQLPSDTQVVSSIFAAQESRAD